MNGIADLLDDKAGPFPVPAVAARPPAVVERTGRRAPVASRGRRRHVLTVTAVMAGLLVAFLVGRSTAPAERVMVPLTAPPTTVWLPNCTGTPDPKCDVETVTRRFIAAWRDGASVAEFVVPGTRLPARVPRSDITRGVQVGVTGSTAVVLWWTASDGMFTATLENYTGAWLVASVGA